MLASMDGQEYLPKVTRPLWMEKKSLWTILSSGSRISYGGCRPRRGDANSQGGYVLKNVYVKMKESGPVGVCTGGTP